jgi:hypothetical protein
MRMVGGRIVGGRKTLPHLALAMGAQERGPEGTNSHQQTMRDGWYMDRKHFPTLVVT